MCEQCSAEVDGWAYPLDGWVLIRATKDGFFMKKGEWGLLRSNDPDFIWEETPTLDPTEGLTDEELDKASVELQDAEDNFTRAAQKFEDDLQGYPASGWELYNAALKAGYDKAKHGRFAFWVFNHLAKHLRDHPTPTFQDRPPSLLQAGDRVENIEE